MKKLIYISGIVSINLSALGALFKLMHWPGAGPALTFGMGMLALLVLPAALINSYKGLEEKKKLSLYIVTFIAGFLEITGMLFKIMHWPGSYIMMMIGIPMPFLVFLPVYLYHYNRDKNKSVKNFFAIIFLLVYIAIYSALLALQVSKDIITSTVLVENKVKDMSNYYKTKSEILYSEISKKKNDSLIQNSQKLKTESDELCEYIHILKYQMVERTDKNYIENFSKEESINLWNIVSKQDREISTIFMLHEKNAIQLKKRLEKHKSMLNDLTKGQNPELDKFIEEAIRTTGGNDKNGDYYSWEEYTFGGNFLVWTIEILTSYQTKIRMAEAEVLEELS